MITSTRMRELLDNALEEGYADGYETGKAEVVQFATSLIEDLDIPYETMLEAIAKLEKRFE